jgi:hypothetical protein
MPHKNNVNIKMKEETISDDKNIQAMQTTLKSRPIKK